MMIFFFDCLFFVVGAARDVVGIFYGSSSLLALTGADDIQQR